jgi:hypothetical protein
MVLHTYRDIFALKLGPQPPASFPPMRIEMSPGVTPIRTRPRPLPVGKREFAQKQVAALERYGFVYSNPVSAWAHPIHIVPKPGPAQNRMTVDLRQANALQKHSAYPMPHLESLLHSLQGSACYGSFDLLQGYWQLRIEPA